MMPEKHSFVIFSHRLISLELPKACGDIFKCLTNNPKYKDSTVASLLFLLCFTEFNVN